jgi:hypothetical protein
MSNAIAVGIDTYSFVKRLIAAGFTEQQAEVQSDTINKVLTKFQDKHLENISTKGDILKLEDSLQKLEKELRADNLRLEVELRTDIENFQSGFSLFERKVEKKFDKLESKIEHIEIAFKGETKLLKWMLSFILAGITAIAIAYFKTLHQ